MNRSENRGLWLLLGLLAMFSLSLFVIPAFVIRPFRHQSESALGLAIAVKRIAPVLTAVARNRGGAGAERGGGGDGAAELF